MKESYDVIVIGAGMVGVSTALHLQAKGQNTLLLDKKGIASETSYGNSGIIESSFVLPFAPPHFTNIPNILLGRNPYARINYPSGLTQLPWMLNFYWQSRKTARIKHGALMRPLVENAIAEHEWLMKDTVGAKYISDHGRIKLHRTQKSFDAGAFEREIIKRFSIPHDIIDAKDFGDIEPDIKPNFYKANRLSGSKRYTNPGKAINAAAQKFVNQGGDFKAETVSAIEKTNGGWLVNGCAADHVVICTGPWANELLKPLGHNFPIGMKRGYHRHYKSTANVKHTLVDADEGYLICPMEQGIRITTGAEFAALNTPPNPIQLDMVLHKAKELIDLSEPAEDNAWMGTRPCMADSLPVIGQSNKHNGLWFNFGHGHCGITAGPASGRLLSEMLTATKPFCDPKAFSAERFLQGGE